MEDIIDVYERPYARKRPVVCLDEKPLQLLGEVREPLPMRPGAVEKIDAEYKRNGTCSIFAIVEPLTGHQHISVRERRKLVLRNLLLRGRLEHDRRDFLRAYVEEKLSKEIPPSEFPMTFSICHIL